MGQGQPSTCQARREDLRSCTSAPQWSQRGPVPSAASSVCSPGNARDGRGRATSPVVLAKASRAVRIAAHELALERKRTRGGEGMVCACAYE